MNGSRGFSLLELLIGLTLLGFILTLLFGGFRLASKSWDSISEISESTTLSRGVHCLDEYLCK